MSDDFKKPVITVIVPVYNTEKYIEKCIDSLKEQTMNNIEIIVINDGSTDNTLKILKKLASGDNRIKIINQSNQKQGAARNRGLDLAKGEYIAFVDADDWIDLDYLEKMHNTALKYRADIAVSSMVQKKEKKFKYYLKYDKIESFENINDIINICKFPVKGYVCGKLFKSDVLKNLRFKENVYYEDTAFLIRAFANTHLLVTVPEVIYHYFSNNSSTVRAIQSKKKFYDRILSAMDVIEFAVKNNINLPDILIVKARKFLSTIKYYRSRIEYYFLGMKIYVRNIDFEQYGEKLLKN